jgi:hypothetical protein
MAGQDFSIDFAGHFVNDVDLPESLAAVIFLRVNNLFLCKRSVNGLENDFKMEKITFANDGRRTRGSVGQVMQQDFQNVIGVFPNT